MSAFSARKVSVLAFLLLFFPLCAEEQPSPPPAPAEKDKEDDDISFRAKLGGFNPITFISDVLSDKYPFRVDFGAEPHRHGSMVFAAADYDWSEGFSQRIRVEYDHYKTASSSANSLSNQEVRSITLTQFPLVFFFGDSDVRARTRFTQVNIGVYFSHAVSNTNTGSFLTAEDDEEFWMEHAGKSGFSINDANQRYRLVGPAFGYSVNFPIHKYVSATLEGFIVPAYLVTLSTSSRTSYYFDNNENPLTNSNSLSFRSLSFPIVRQMISLDFFRYMRIKGLISYQHLDMRTLMDDNIDIANYSVHTITIRYGGEILNPARTRKKSAHLRAGLYYEMTWNKNYLQNSPDTEYEGKWIICFST